MSVRCRRAVPIVSDRDSMPSERGETARVVAARIGVTGILLGAAWLASEALRRTLDLAPDAGIVTFPRWSVALVLAVSALTSLLAMLAVLRGRGERSRLGRGLAPIRAALYVATLSWLVYVALLQPYEEYHFIAYAGVASGGFGLVLLVGFFVPVPRRLGRVADVVLFNLCLLLLGGELGLRGAARVWKTPLLSRSALIEERLARSRFDPGRIRYGFRCDDRGFYDDAEDAVKQEGSAFVVTIGDSFSSGPVPHHFHYTTACERLVEGLRIYNVGAPAIGPPEYLHLLRDEVLPLHPDHVVLSLYLGNDIQSCVRFRDSDDLAKRWFDRGNVLIWLLPTRLRRLSEAGVGRRRSTRGDAIVTDPDAMVARWPWLAHPALERPSFNEETYLEIVASRIRSTCRPADLHHYDRFEAVLDAIQRACGETPLSVLLIPDECHVEDALWRSAVARHLQGEKLDRGLPQRRVSALLRARGIAYADALPALRAASPLDDGDRHLYHRCDTHLNARGNALLARVLADLLRSVVR